MRLIKQIIIKITTSIQYSAKIFLYVNLTFATLYIYFATSNEGVKYSWYEFIVHTFIASFTLSTPKFIKFPTEGVWLDLIVLFHTFISYLFLGILVSMIYRKATRT